MVNPSNVLKFILRYRFFFSVQVAACTPHLLTSKSNLPLAVILTAILSWMILVDGDICLSRRCESIGWCSVELSVELSDDILGFIYSWGLFICLISTMFASFKLYVLVICLCALVLLCLLRSWYQLRPVDG